MKTAVLEDLLGEHVLDAVDFMTPSDLEGYTEMMEAQRAAAEARGEYISYDAAEMDRAQHCLFRLDGVVYMITEDPQDGYRSSVKDLFVTDGEMTNVFPPCRVLGRKKPDSDTYGGGKNDVVEFIDLETGLAVLEVGTDAVDDYYPSFVANFQPQNMAVNADKKKEAA